VEVFFWSFHPPPAPPPKGDIKWLVPRWRLCRNHQKPSTSSYRRRPARAKSGGRYPENNEKIARGSWFAGSSKLKPSHPPPFTLSLSKGWRGCPASAGRWWKYFFGLSILPLRPLRRGTLNGLSPAGGGGLLQQAGGGSVILVFPSSPCAPSEGGH
jgi:hypothetical protein